MTRSANFIQVLFPPSSPFVIIKLYSSECYEKLDHTKDIKVFFPSTSIASKQVRRQRTIMKNITKIVPRCATHKFLRIIETNVLLQFLFAQGVTEKVVLELLLKLLKSN